MFFFLLSKGEDQWIFDLQSLATLAAARALELGSQDSGTTDAEMQYPARRTLNLRRKCSWTPRHEPVTHPSFVFSLMYIFFIPFKIYVVCTLYLTNLHPTLLTFYLSSSFCEDFDSRKVLSKGLSHTQQLREGLFAFVPLGVSSERCHG